MFESDADRLAMIKSLGGIAASVRGQTLWGIFDNGNVDVLNMVESAGPSLNCRSFDVAALNVTKEDDIDIPSCAGAPQGDQYRVKKMDPDGTGMTIVHLKK